MANWSGMGSTRWDTPEDETCFLLRSEQMLHLIVATRLESKWLWREAAVVLMLMLVLMLMWTALKGSSQWLKANYGLMNYGNDIKCDDTNFR